MADSPRAVEIDGEIADAGADIDALSLAAAGLVLAVAFDAAEGGLPLEAAGALLDGAEAPSCRAALTALAALPRARRARALTRLLARVSGPLPAGAERVHPGWLRAALEGESTETLLAVTDGLPPEIRRVAQEIVAARGDDGVHDSPGPARLDPDTLAELRRALFASFADMPSPGAPPAPDLPDWRRWATLPVDSIIEALTRYGAEVLGVSLVGAPPVVLARAAALAGQGVADLVLAAARLTSTGTVAERDRARALVSSAAALSRSPAALQGTAAVGLLALADRWASLADESVRAVAQRFPPALGQILVVEHARAAAARRPGGTG